MPQQYSERMTNDSTETSVYSVTIDEIEENTQVTVASTGWSAEEKERMKAYGYDSLDMVRAWYS
jgi:hypothetical protein